MSPSPSPLVLTRDEAAAAARLSKDKIDRAIRTGELKAKKNGRSVLIPVQALQSYLENLPDA
jgi:excisionase family DNA binding protein